MDDDTDSHALVPYDGTDRAATALDRVLERHSDTTVTVLSVVEPLSETGCERSDAPLAPDAGMRADGGPTAAEAIVTERRDDVAADLRADTEPGVPAATIVAYADDHDVDEIVMGTTGRSGLRRLLVGSVAETVAETAPVPVTLVD